MMNTKARVYTNDEQDEMLLKINSLMYFFHDRHIFRHTLPVDTLQNRNIDKKDECCCCRNL